MLIFQKILARNVKEFNRYFQKNFKILPKIVTSFLFFVVFGDLYRFYSETILKIISKIIRTNLEDKSGF